MKTKNLFAVMVEDEKTPTKLHETYFDAEKEAIRLTKLMRKKSYVLKAVSLVELQEVSITRLDLPTEYSQTQ